MSAFDLDPPARLPALSSAVFAVFAVSSTVSAMFAVSAVPSTVSAVFAVFAVQL